MSYVRTPPHLPVHQADAVLNQANPVSTTLYTVLNTTRNVRIIGITVRVTWTVQPTPLEIVITIDGITITHSMDNPATATNYEAVMYGASEEFGQALLALHSYAPYRAFLYEGKSIRVQARTTGGTVQNLTARVKYAKRD